MTDYDDLFEATTPAESVFRDKGALDPLAEPEEVVAREEQERQLATILNGVNEGYLPTTVSIYGPPGTGKTLTVRRLSREFEARHDDVAVEYVNLKECRTLFSAANEIHLELTGEKLGAYEGLDGVFEGIWQALEEYPEWTILLLDEIDHVRHDSNYEPSEFFYRLLRGEGKLKRGLNLSVFLISNELLEVDLRLDSRVRSAMSGEEVFFPPYGIEELNAIITPRCQRAFHARAVPEDTRLYGIRVAARRWGDARKALRLFRQAGETANDQRLDTVTRECIDDNLEASEREAVTEKLLSLPFNHFLVLFASVARRRDGEVIQPVTTEDIAEVLTEAGLPAEYRLTDRSIRNLVNDLETMGLVETWVESRGRYGRVKHVSMTAEPSCMHEVAPRYLETTDQVDVESLLDE